MKFAEHLLAHITPEWRRQYIVYEDMKSMLYEAIENMPTLESAAPEEIERLTRAFDEDFLAFCEKELFKINVFYEEKLAEAKRKFDTLKKELDALFIDNSSSHHHHHHHHHYYQYNYQQQQPNNNNNNNNSGPRFSISRLVGGAAALQETTSFRSTLNLRQRQSLLSSRRQSNAKSHLLTPDGSGLPIKKAASKLDDQQQQQQQQQVAFSIGSARLINNNNNNSTNNNNNNNNDNNEIDNNENESINNNYKNYGSLAASKNVAATNLDKAPSDQENRISPLLTNRVDFKQPRSRNSIAYANSSSNNNNNNNRQRLSNTTTTSTRTTQITTTKPIDRRKMNDLKLAFSEFYLSLVLLQNYQRLNFTGFRKILKKHDKLIANEEGKRWHLAHVECAFFHTNKDVDKLIEETENIVTFKLESGDRQKAMKKLRVPPLNDVPKPWTAFRVGFSLGAFVVLAMAVILTGTFQQTGGDWRIVFRLYRSSLFIIFFIFLVGINIYGWRAHGVNHVLIFELDPRDHLGGQDLLEIAFSFGLLWCISVLLFLWSGPIGIPPLINPMILNVIMFIYLLNPTRTFNYSARYWLLCCICRVVAAPFYRVRFSDFWLADQLNSLVPVLLDIEYTSCFYFTSTDLYGKSDDLDRCIARDTKDRILRTIVACLPAWWRFAQCVRRYFDEGHRANPHLLNAGKYATVWLVVVFSTLTELYEGTFSHLPVSPFFVCWVVSLIISSCYTYIWDVKMDWGLFDSKAPSEYRFLREELVYPVKYYYVAIVEDFVLRFGWTLNLSLTKVGNIPSDLITLVLAPLEIFRRFLWNFYRLENEHLNNCGEFRAVRDISISGQNIDMSALNRILSIMDEPDGLSSFRSRVKAQLAAAKKKALISDQMSDPSNVLII